MVYMTTKNDRVTEIKIGKDNILKIDPESNWIITQVFYPDGTKAEDMKNLTIVIEKVEKDDENVSCLY